MEKKRYYILLFALLIFLTHMFCMPACDRGYILFRFVIGGAMYFLAYGAMRSCRDPSHPMTGAILLSGMAFMIPFATNPDEAFFQSVLFLFMTGVPVIAAAVGYQWMRRWFRHKVTILIGNLTLCMLFIFLLFVLTGTELGAEGPIVVAFLLENVIWTTALIFTDGRQNRKTGQMTAWLLILLVFYFWTAANHDASWEPVRAKWNLMIFYAWPVVLPVLTEAIRKAYAGHVEERWKYDISYFAIVLAIIWVQTDFAYRSFSDRPGIELVIYYLFLADLVFIKEIRRRPDLKEGHGNSVACAAAANGIALCYTFFKNMRVREIVQNIVQKNILQGSWLNYRMEAVRAFFTGDLSRMETVYGKEQYVDCIHGVGMASIRFRNGFLPVIWIVVCMVILLWLFRSLPADHTRIPPWHPYMAAGLEIRMGIALASEICMVSGPWMGFPFTRTNGAEWFLLFLLLYESERLHTGSHRG